MWVIELENQGYGRSSAPRPPTRPGPDAAATGACWRTTRDRPCQRGQLHRAGLRAGPGHHHPDRLPGLDTFPRPGHGRAVPPGPRGGMPTRRRSRRSAVSWPRRASWAPYLQDMGNEPGRDHTVSTARGPACGHPATSAVDHTQKAERAPVRRPPRRVHLLGRRRQPALVPAHILSSRRCRVTWPGPRHPGLLPHRAEPVQQRPRRAVRHRRRRRARAGRHHAVPGDLLTTSRTPSDRWATSCSASPR